MDRIKRRDRKIYGEIQKFFRDEPIDRSLIG
jgi:hypothetical protein